MQAAAAISLSRWASTPTSCCWAAHNICHHTASKFINTALRAAFFISTGRQYAIFLLLIILIIHRRVLHVWSDRVCTDWLLPKTLAPPHHHAVYSTAGSSGNVFFSPSRSQLFISIPIPAARFSQFYSHSLPSPIGYSHPLPLPVTY